VGGRGRYKEEWDGDRMEGISKYSDGRVMGNYELNAEDLIEGILFEGL